jgi:hypothetical protein
VYDEAFLKISAEASAERAFDHVVAVSRFHRIQASPGYREAAEYCVDRLLETSPDARVIHYPADPEVSFWSFPSFEEWHGKRAVLGIVKPASMAGKLADFEACPISLIQRSRPTPPDGLTAELIYAGEGTRASDYRNGKGKIAICDAHCPRHVYDAAVEAGVAGVILYRHRPLPPLRKGLGVEGVRQYNSFWWDEDKLFGFVLTPEDGQRLVAYITSAEGRKRPLTAWAMVESESYPGSLEVVTSLIPGRQKKEILLIAHLCHPKPSAGDNASGVAALLEAHRVLTRMVSNGELPQPEYGIRFLLVPEITGTFAYLAREKGARRRLMFGLNLDMVGQKQEVTGSTLCIEAPPLSAASFTPFLLEEVVRRAFRHSTNPGSTGDLLSIKIQATPFSGGSDHFILSDPTVGVPTPMLLQWPDKYYHTSGDTPDKVSPDALRRIAIAAGVYAYTIALAAEDDMLWLARLAGRGLRRKAIDDLGAGGNAALARRTDPNYRTRVLLKAGKQAIRSIGKLLPRSRALKACIASEEKALAGCMKQEADLSRKAASPEGGSEPGPAGPIPGGAVKYKRAVIKRLMRGPVDMGAILTRLGKRRRSQYRKWMAREKQAYMLQALALFWADGKRSIAEIADHVDAELGYTNPDFLKFYFDTLAEAGIVKISRR